MCICKLIHQSHIYTLSIIALNDELINYKNIYFYNTNNSCIYVSKLHLFSSRLGLYKRRHITSRRKIGYQYNSQSRLRRFSGIHIILTYHCLAIPSIVPKFVWLGTDVHAHVDDLFRIIRADDRRVFARKLCELRKIARNSGIYEAFYYLYVILLSPFIIYLYIHVRLILHIYNIWIFNQNYI